MATTVLSLCLAVILADEPAVPPPHTVGPELAPLAERLAKQRRWGVEIGPLWIAIGNFVRPKLTFTAWARRTFAGDVVLAPVVRIPQRLSGTGTIFEVGGELGYRQFFWRGFNVEATALLLRSQVDSSVDGRRYTGFNVFVTGAVGWRVEFWLRRTSFYVLPQVGVGSDVVRTNPPAAAEAPRPRFIGDVLLGFRF
ncbi:MAG: hypothetical protein IAG13_36195 [Deltaproteobacteria bacterium]|nr:hypothetical protein [Nannocystaceae bacterium]